uniref:Protein sleepless n=1 Tax=Parastrongyloides trichosuri TaxID=131310 RepID=A0A0N4Z2E7_PARTI
MLLHELLLLIFISFPKEVVGLACQRCEGWEGDDPPGWVRDGNTDCANRNNQCYTNFFCAKIAYPKGRNAKYELYSSQCFDTNQLTVYPGQVVSVENNKCYEVSDGGNPAIIKTYCFCRERDHCNGVIKLESYLISLIFLLISFIFFYY